MARLTQVTQRNPRRAIRRKTLTRPTAAAFKRVQAAKGVPVLNSVVLDYISCNLCGSDSYTVLYTNQMEYMRNRDKRQDFSYSFSPETMKAGQIVQCNKCRLVYTNPRERGIMEAYEGVEDDQYIKSTRERLLTFRALLRDIERRCPHKGKILDIGCAAGYFLEIATRRGWQPYGIELSKYSAKEARRRGAVVIDKPLAQAGFERNFFDFISMNAVIEHFLDPMSELMESNKVLKKGGMIAIYTGNIDSLFARLAKRKWWYFMRMHIYFFSERTLRLMLQKAGFKAVDITTHTLVMSYPMMVNSAKRYPPLYFVMKQFLRIPFFRRLTVPMKINGEMLVFAKKVVDVDEIKKR